VILDSGAIHMGVGRRTRMQLIVTLVWGKPCPPGSGGAGLGRKRLDYRVVVMSMEFCMNISVFARLVGVMTVTTVSGATSSQDFCPCARFASRYSRL
jgi:hypothetical protein